jgi:hypothetical protein
VSRRSEAKKARRNKRRAAHGANWLPDNVLDELVATQAAIATDLEAFDERVTDRGWTFDDDESDDEFAFWFYEPSAADIDDEDRVPVTTIWMSADEDAKIVHLMLAGTAEDFSFEPEEFFERIDAIQAYRFGESPGDAQRSLFT